MKTSLNQFRHELEICSRCGACNADCPTYVVTQEESRLARGRAALMEALIEYRLPPSSRFHAVIDTCVGCHSCVIACPSDVPVDAMSAAARAFMHERKAMPISKRIAYARMARPGGLIGMTRLARVASMPLRSLHTLRANGPVPSAIRGRTLPLPAPRFFEEIAPDLVPAWTGWNGTSSKPALGRVAFFYGCMINLVYPDIGIATAEVISRMGYEVAIPKRQPCCGVPMLTAGEYEGAKQAAHNALASMMAAEPDVIVTSCATCSATLREEYRELLHGDPDVDAFADRVVDISQFLADRGETLHIGGLDAKVTYHDPCHLNRWLGVTKEPRELIRATGADLIEMEEAAMCCGFGGSFSFDHYDLASKISARKAAYASATGAEVIATGCPGCIMHIRDAIARAGGTQRVVHPVELIAEALG